MEMSGLMGTFYRITEWILRFVVTNLLWVFFNLPNVYFFYNFVMMLTEVDVVTALIVNLLPVAILSPFVLFPATSALFSVVRKWIMDDPDVPLLRMFMKGYKSNYKISMQGGFVFVPLWALYVFDYYYYVNAVSSALSYAFLLIGMFLLAFNIHFFSLAVHFHMRLRDLLKNALFISIGRPLISLGIVLITLAILYISTMIFTWMIPFFAFSIIAYCSFRGFYMIYSKAHEMKGEEDDDLPEESGRSEGGDHAEKDNHRLNKPSEHEQPATDAAGKP
jgi:uncharacterized membrane protein YesL